MSRSIFILACAVALTACGGGTIDTSTLAGKKEQLAAYKKELSELNTNIATLEKEIAKLDTTQKAGRSRLVSIQPIASKTFNHFVEMQGSVIADQQIYATPKMPGTITRVLVKTGDRVKQGQLLAEMDGELFLRNKASLVTQLDFAKSIFDKQKALWDQKIGTEIQYLQAKNSVDALQKQIATLDEQMEQLKVIAPISGTVDDVTMKAGQPGAPGNQFSSILIVNLSKLKVKAEVAEAYAGKIREGVNAELTMPDLQRTFNSRIAYVSKVISPMNRTFTIEANLPGEAKDVIPNMLTNVRIADYSRANAIVVPVNTIQNDLDGEFVYIATTEGNKTIAKKARIKVGQVFGEEAEVLSGLTAGMNLVTIGYQEINEGEELKVQ